MMIPMYRLWLHSLYELRNLENKHKNNPLVSTETVRHWVGLYIILYVSGTVPS